LENLVRRGGNGSEEKEKGTLIFKLMGERRQVGGTTRRGAELITSRKHLQSKRKKCEEK